MPILTTAATPALTQLRRLVEDRVRLHPDLRLSLDPEASVGLDACLRADRGVLFVVLGSLNVARITWFPDHEEKLEWLGIPVFWPGGRQACETDRRYVLRLLCDAGFHGYETRRLANNLTL